jgi:hypothetical protein
MSSGFFLAFHRVLMRQCEVACLAIAPLLFLLKSEILKWLAIRSQMSFNCIFIEISLRNGMRTWEWKWKFLRACGLREGDEGMMMTVVDGVLVDEADFYVAIDPFLVKLLH